MTDGKVDKKSSNIYASSNAAASGAGASAQSHTIHTQMRIHTYLPAAKWSHAQSPLDFYAKQAAEKYQAKTPTDRALVDLSTLTDYEKEEIKGYAQDMICYTGLPRDKKPQPPMDWDHGKPFDDEKGYYDGRVGDHIAYRFQIIKVIGIGSFSTVFRVIDWSKNVHMAMKVIQRNDAFMPYLEREVNILQYLRNGDPEGTCNAVPLLDIFLFRGHYCMVFEVLYCSLFNVIGYSDYQGLPMNHVKKVACHLLKCLEYLDILGVVHGDLKPENIMLRNPRRTAIKVIDFGWSWLQGRDPILSDYFQSRYYRAPEVILQGPLTHAVDMWSYGCIVAELACGLPIFTGNDKHDQLIVILEILGIPPASVAAKWGAKKKKYFSALLEPFYCSYYEHKQTANSYFSRLYIGCESTGSKEVRGVPGSKHIRTALRQTSTKVYPDEFIDFLLRCLDWDPAIRMTASEAIHHVWLADLFKEV